ncbi:hypothetical protein C6361_21685 [Plantactinospora sp. BC1]|uniref:hypothetical protein n=1 Tax=Plantactinospora sp. BC1 TaxID=2108470 RepID=UPI000D16BC9D|nr:hypothetical protein [Plantactinospora sp. BC1]AVT31657.1 hypothetical protein C6361_21685 [Plantactinospora sp. BC1]
MGASSWSRKVPYQADIAAALQQAREEAYQEGDCYRAEPNLRARQMSEQEYAAASVAEMREGFLAAFGEDAGDPDDGLAREEWHAAQIDVVDPDTLLASQPFSGTHSVIDMTGVADRPEGGRVAPLPDDELDRWFGTRRPDVAAVERALGEGLSGFERWHGAYVVGYDGDRPESIYFFGWSGD